MRENIPEYVWAGGTVVVFAVLLMVPLFWFHPAQITAKGTRHRTDAIWNAVGIFIVGVLLVLGSGVTSVWLIPVRMGGFWELVFGTVCVSPMLLISTWLAWLAVWPHCRGSLSRGRLKSKESQLSLAQLMIAMVVLALFMGGVRVAFELSFQARPLILGVSFLLSLYGIFGILLARTGDD